MIEPKFYTFPFYLSISLCFSTASPFHHRRQLAQVLVAWHPALQWYHIGSVSGGGPPESRLQDIFRCRRGSVSTEESSNCRNLQGENHSDLWDDDCKAWVSGLLIVTYGIMVFRWRKTHVVCYKTLSKAQLSTAITYKKWRLLSIGKNLFSPMILKYLL